MALDCIGLLFPLLRPLFDLLSIVASTVEEKTGIIDCTALLFPLLRPLTFHCCVHARLKTFCNACPRREM